MKEQKEKLSESNFFKKADSLSVESMKLHTAGYDSNTHKYVCYVSMKIKSGKTVNLTILIDDIVSLHFTKLNPYDKLSVYQLCFQSNYAQKNANIVGKRQACIKAMSDDIQQLTVNKKYNAKNECDYQVQIQYKNDAQCTRLIDANEFAELYLDYLILEKSPVISTCSESEESTSISEEEVFIKQDREEQPGCTCNLF